MTPAEKRAALAYLVFEKVVDVQMVESNISKTTKRMWLLLMYQERLCRQTWRIELI